MDVAIVAFLAIVSMHVWVDILFCNQVGAVLNYNTCDWLLVDK